jgi:hypothetical protein
MAYRRAISWPAADVDAIAIVPRKGAGARATSETERARQSARSEKLPQRPWRPQREPSVIAAIAKSAIDFIVSPPVLFSEVYAIMEDDDTLRADAPLCPTCKNPMERGRVRVEGYPYVPSFECWPCLEVFTEADEPR